MKKKARSRHWAGIMALTLIGSAATTAVNAQARIYGYPTDANRLHEYALLNGDLLALYLNDRGDLGAPYPIINGFPGAKPPGIVDPVTGRPSSSNIADDGRILPTDNPPTYGALFSRTSTPSSTIGGSVRQKSEYLTAGAGSVAEGFSLRGNQGLSGPGNTFILPGDMILQNFSVSGDSRTGALSATSQLEYPTDSGTLEVMQNVVFQETDAPPNRVKFTISFTNNSSEAITGLRYARAVDPNQGFTTGETNQRFRTQADPNAFALNSLVGDRGFGLGVFPDGNTEGTILVVTPETREDALLTNPTAQLSSNSYVLLGATTTLPNGTNTASASLFQPAGDPNLISDDILLDSTLDFINDAAFTNMVNDNLSVPSGNAGLVLLSPILPDIAANGGMESFTFYYFFDALQGPPPGVPEPGTVALLVSSVLCGGSLLRRRRQK